MEEFARSFGGTPSAQPFGGVVRGSMSAQPFGGVVRGSMSAQPFGGVVRGSMSTATVLRDVPQKRCRTVMSAALH
jgi:hypothetical protein